MDIPAVALRVGDRSDSLLNALSTLSESWAAMTDQEKPYNLPNTRRPSLPMLIAAALFIIIPFMFWYGTWFGRELRVDEIERYLNDSEHPRKIQHALTQ